MTRGMNGYLRGRGEIGGGVSTTVDRVTGFGLPDK
jgi:hypothetical protein